MKIEKSAIIKATGKQIRVFKRKSKNVWIAKSDYTTEYAPSELNII